ncbi:hypothetical protein H8E07_01910 [bacterium]|nr:hypothetical protein [bacterium]
MRDADSGIAYLIEFIGVESSPPVLAKYRELVSRYFGPANGILVDRGMLHCFVALENVDILVDTRGAVPWNQIHLSDDWDEGDDIDWAATYKDLFWTEFYCELDSVGAEVPPADKTRVDYRGRLLAEICVRWSA